MFKTSFAEIFAGNVPRIDNITIFPDQAFRDGVAESMSGATQVSGDHLLGFNITRIRFDELADHFKIENPVLLTRRGGGFAIECGRVPEDLRTTFSLGFRPSFREEGLPLENQRVLKQVNAIKEFQVRLDRGVIGFNAYVVTGRLWAFVRGLGNILSRWSPRRFRGKYIQGYNRAILDQIYSEPILKTPSASSLREALRGGSPR